MSPKKPKKSAAKPAPKKAKLSISSKVMPRPSNPAAHPSDPALSILLAHLEKVEHKLDRVLAALEKGGAPADKKLRPGQPAAPSPATGIGILPPTGEAPEGSSLQPIDPDTAQFLARTPLFAKLSAQECSMLSIYLEGKTLPKGSSLFQQGDFGDAMYIVKLGGLEIYKNDVFGSVRVAEVRPGGLVGEMALVENKPRSANVRSSEDSKLLVLSRSAYADLKKVHPQVATKFQDELLLLLSGRLRQTTEKLVGK
jgi:CRP/FNR family cyclic AMP-dependent transcriptional regulator